MATQKPQLVRQQVRQRANQCCKYCHASEQWQYVEFTVDHITPVAQGGQDSIDNLALACFHCNRRKSAKTTAVDPQTGANFSLFNPRQSEWSEHFIWSKDCLQIMGTTAVGRATVGALNFNRERIRAIRAADRSVDRHPPADDPVQI